MSETKSEQATELEQTMGRSRDISAALATALPALLKGEITKAEAKKLADEATSVNRDLNRLIKAMKAKLPAGD